MEGSYGFEGIAEDASPISVRVLTKNGKGKVSKVIAGLEWILDNHEKYGIRVVNLSLGAPVAESYRDDPLCEAVGRLIRAGIVVVAAAGNHGEGESGEVLYGSIHSPAIHPQVIAVGAARNEGFLSPFDFDVARYSSRGPSYGDRFLKPDIVASGSHMRGAEAAENNLVLDHGFLHLDGKDNAAFMELNGSSMAAPLVAGTVARNTALTDGESFGWEF